MKLTLQNGYPYPFPANATQAEQDSHAEAAASYSIVIEGVKSMQTMHTVTVEFNTLADMLKAQEQTGWPVWGTVEPTLEAIYSEGDGYGVFPALVAGDKAYCGVFLQG